MSQYSIVFVANIAAPYEVKFVPIVSQLIQAKYFFHSHIGTWRPEYWKMPLPKNFEKVPGPVFRLGNRYYAIGLLWALWRNSPDLVVADDFFNPHSMISLIYAKIFNKKIIIRSETIRKNGKFYSKKSFRVAFIRAMYSRVNAIMAVSTGSEEFLKNILPEIEHKITAVSSPVDIEEFFSHDEREISEGCTLLFGNSLTIEYGAITALQILKDLRQRHKVRLIMNGNGPARVACEDYILSNNLGSCVSFTDNIKSWDDLHKIYQDADILILPATFSNGNATILEAMASGMGMVISDSINFSSDFVSKNRGFVVAPHIEEFVSAIEQYISDPMLIVEHGKYNRQAVTHRRYQKTAENYASFFAKVINS